MSTGEHLPDESSGLNEIERIYEPTESNPEGIARYKSYVEDDVIHIVAGGELDTLSASMLREVIDAQTETFPKVTRVEIDFADVRFIDSASIGALAMGLVKMRDAAIAAAQELDSRVIVSDPGVYRIFELTGLDRPFGVEFIEPLDD